MATGRELHRVLDILLKYAEPNKSVPVAARHDAIHIAGPEPDKLTKAEREYLEAVGCGYDEGWEGWYVFV